MQHSASVQEILGLTTLAVTQEKTCIAEILEQVDISSSQISQCLSISQ